MINSLEFYRLIFDPFAFARWTSWAELFATPDTELKYPKKGAVAKLREFYLEIVKKPLTPEQKANLEEVFKKKDQ
ncbi:MAG: hypothetical protein ACK5WZ_07015, partial [Pseudobdellovibrionaceae bacterium]